MASSEGKNFNAGCLRGRSEAQMSVGKNLGSISTAATPLNSHPIRRQDEGVEGEILVARNLGRRGLLNIDLNVPPTEAPDGELTAEEGGRNGPETAPPPPADVAPDDSAKKAGISDEGELNFNVEMRTAGARMEENKGRNRRWIALLGVAENALREKKEEEIRKRKRGASQEAGEPPATRKKIGGQRRLSLVEEWNREFEGHADMVQQPESSATPVAGQRDATTSPPRKLQKPTGATDVTGGKASAEDEFDIKDLPLTTPESIDRVFRPVLKWLKTGVKELSASYEDELSSTKAELKKSRAKLAKAESAAKSARSELEAEKARAVAATEKAEKADAEMKKLKAELDAARDREARAAAGQGEVLRAYTKRLLLSEQFSELVNDIAGLINGNAALDALEEVANDVPDLDISKYGYKRLDEEALLRPVAEIIQSHLGRLPVLNDLASSSTLLSAEQIAACQTDRDPTLDAVYEALLDRPLVEDEGEDLEDEATGDERRSKNAEDPKPAEAVEGAQSEQPTSPDKEVGDS